MTTKKITQATIKRLVKEGAAVDLNALYLKNAANPSKLPKPTEFEVLGISVGSVGRNGALLKHKKTGKMYGITSRSSALFYFL